MTNEELDAISPTDEERAFADAHVKKAREHDGAWSVFIESTEDMFCVVAREARGRAEEDAETLRQGIANVIAELFAMRRDARPEPAR